MNKNLAEFLGTFIMILVGTGSVVINQQTGGLVTHAGISLTFGLIVTIVIYIFGPISGAHINPAITLAFYIEGRFDREKILPYIISQLAGAIVASLLLKFLFPTNHNLGTTLPSGSQMQSFFLEVFLTFILIYSVYWLIALPSTKNIAAIVVGVIVFLEAFFAGKITGASMNPARSIAPAIVSGHLTSLWIYIFAPISGATIAVYTFRLTKIVKICKSN